MAAADNATATFEAHLAPHLDALLRTAHRLTQDAAQAEDLLQDALLKAFRFFDSFQPDSNFKAWIFKILTNTFVNAYRSRQRRGNQVDLESLGEAETPHRPDQPDAELSFTERTEAVYELVDERIRQALLDLPENLRTVFVLAAVEELKYREIAEILDCPVGTVMSRLFRGRALLKQRLESFAEEEGIPAQQPEERKQHDDAK